MASDIWLRLLLCISAADVIARTLPATSPMPETTLASSAPTSSMRDAPEATCSLEVAISDLISRAAPLLRSASVRTSAATTAKPRPFSPARAASTAALSARMLVWKAMPSITPMMSCTRCELVRIACIVSTASRMRLPPDSAISCTRLASCSTARASSAFCFTEPLRSCTLAEVCSRLAAWRSVRWASSPVPAASDSLACETKVASLRMSATSADMLAFMSSSDAAIAPNSSRPAACDAAATGRRRFIARTPACSGSSERAR